MSDQPVEMLGIAWWLAATTGADMAIADDACTLTTGGRSVTLEDAVDSLRETRQRTAGGRRRVEGRIAWAWTSTCTATTEITKFLTE